jgi:hypothetical protein
LLKAREAAVIEVQPMQKHRSKAIHDLICIHVSQGILEVTGKWDGCVDSVSAEMHEKASYEPIVIRGVFVEVVLHCFTLLQSCYCPVEPGLRRDPNDWITFKVFLGLAKDKQMEIKIIYTMCSYRWMNQ